MLRVTLSITLTSTFLPTRPLVRMGTLSDITSKVGNREHVSNPLAKGYQPLASPGSKENHANMTTSSPRFMAPTQAFASRQTNTPSSIRAGTPTSINSTSQSKPFFSRVKLRRTNHTQREKRSPPPSAYTEGLSFPDKVCYSYSTPLYAAQPDH